MACQLAAAAFHLNTLRQLNGGTQVGVQRDFIQGVFTQVNQLCSELFQLFGITLNFTLADPDNFIIFILDIITGDVVEPVFGLLCHFRLLKKEANTNSLSAY